MTALASRLGDARMGKGRRWFLGLCHESLLQQAKCSIVPGTGLRIFFLFSEFNHSPEPHLSSAGSAFLASSERPSRTSLSSTPRRLIFTDTKRLTRNTLRLDSSPTYGNEILSPTRTPPALRRAAASTASASRRHTRLGRRKTPSRAAIRGHVAVSRSTALLPTRGVNRRDALQSARACLENRPS